MKELSNVVLLSAKKAVVAGFCALLCSVFLIASSSFSTNLANSLVYKQDISDSEKITVYSNGKPKKIAFKDIKSSLKLHSVGDIQVVSDDSNLPIVISNNSNYDIDVILRCASTSQKVDVTDDTEYQKIRLEANTDSNFIIKVHSRANGDANLNITLTTKNGLVIGKTKAKLHVFANIGATLKFIFIALTALLIIFGIYRTIKKVHKISKKKFFNNSESEMQHSAIFETVKSES